MSANCPACRARASQVDRYCAACGAPLARLKWQLHGAEAVSEDGRVAVRRGTKELQVELVNEGVVPAGLVLPSDALDRLPSWVDLHQLKALQEDAITIAPGEREVIQVPFVAEQLQEVFQGQARGRTGRPLDAPIELLTTLCETSEGGFRPRPLALTLVVAREPWFQPAGSLYRFLPLQTLREGFQHVLDLRNESAEDIELVGPVQLRDATTSTGASQGFAIGSPRVNASDLLQVVTSDENPLLKPGEKRRIQLQFNTPDLDGLGWFSVEVVQRYRHRRQGQVVARVDGVLGRAPTLVTDAPSPIAHPSVERDEAHTLVLRNPGDLPVRVRSIDVLRDGEPQPEGQRDWFRLSGLEPGEVIAPGETRELRYELRPGDRPESELDQVWSSRRIRVLHDGTGDRLLERTIDAQLGVVQVPQGVYMGIDFGTSNSMVCLFKPDTRKYLALPLETGDGLQDQLASLMFYLGTESDDDRVDAFLYGQAANEHADVNPSNLVRSIKSVIARDPDTEYHFLERGPAGAYRRKSYRPQELLDLFICELRRRAELAVSTLDMSDLRELRMGPKVRFREAIFSHPVEVNSDMKRALMRAAHTAGLNLHLTAKDFIEERCVDEATAAALTYVYSRLDPNTRVGVDHELVDVERVLCVDIGGGTTDVAAVEIRDLAAFWDEDALQVTVQLNATAGDPMWGGDDLDLLLAGWVLESLREQTHRMGAAIQAQEIERAAGFRSFGEYYNGYKMRRGRRDGDALQEAYALYNKAVEVLRKSEAAKRTLSAAKAVKLSFDPHGWPRDGEQPTDSTPLEVVLQVERLERTVRDQTRRRTALLDQVRRNSGWTWDTVTTVLFTGQGVRVPCIREELLLYIEGQRKSASEDGDVARLLVVQPDDRTGFDPKRCVGMGAAIWGTREDGEWVNVVNRMQLQLTHDVQRRHGPFHFRTLPGLERGTALPARAEHSFRKPRTSLELFRDGNLHLVFTFKVPVTTVTIVVTGPGDVRAEADGQVVLGEVVS